MGTDQDDQAKSLDGFLKTEIHTPKRPKYLLIRTPLVRKPTTIAQEIPARKDSA